MLGLTGSPTPGCLSNDSGASGAYLIDILMNTHICHNCGKTPVRSEAQETSHTCKSQESGAACRSDFGPKTQSRNMPVGGNMLSSPTDVPKLSGSDFGAPEQRKHKRDPKPKIRRHSRVPYG